LFSITAIKALGLARTVLFNVCAKYLFPLFSILISVVVILVQFSWTGNIKTDLNNILQFFFVNFTAVKGMIQTVYELLIKSVPVLNEKFS